MKKSKQVDKENKQKLSEDFKKTKQVEKESIRSNKRKKNEDVILIKNQCWSKLRERKIKINYQFPIKK